MVSTKKLSKKLIKKLKKEFKEETGRTATEEQIQKANTFFQEHNEEMITCMRKITELLEELTEENQTPMEVIEFSLDIIINALKEAHDMVRKENTGATSS